MSGAETLFVRCTRCGRPFPAPLQIDRSSLEAMVLGSAYVCPHCGASDVYIKADHWFELIIR